MRRMLPWALLVAAVALAAFLGWHLLGSDGGGDGLEGEFGVALGEDEVAAPSLVGAPGARLPPSRPTGPLRILGEVVDDDGRPLTGVSVVARLTTWERDPKARIRQSIAQIEAPSIPAIVADAVSGADGTFAMHVAEAARYQVEARLLPPKRSSSPHAFFYGEVDEQRVTVRVREGSMLRGRVLGADDDPLAAVLTATAYHPPQWTGVAAPVATNPADGTFSIPALPPGRWNVRVVLPGRVRLTGLVVEMPRDEEWTIRLGGETGSIVGTVTGRADEPVAGANVLVQTRDVSRSTSAQVRGTTGADGTYAIDAVPPGAVAALSVLHDDYVALTESPRWPAGAGPRWT